jgi:AhpD family alkylhydroperoxidase
MLDFNKTPKTRSLKAFLFAAAALAVSAAAEPKAGSPAAETMADIQKTLGFVPQFFEAYPEAILPGVWDEMKTLQLNPATALSGKEKELIGLGVAAQIPCKYCIEAHTEFAKLNGANDAEVGDAISMAAITRHWSTFLNGIQTDEAKFRSEIAKIVADVKKGPSGAAPKPVAVVDGQTALKDIAQTLGSTPEFFRKFPDAARAGAWRTFKEVQLNPKSALSGKDKELVGLAVASQVPCKFCVIAHTEFAKLNGATENEIAEAIAMSSFTREMSTLLNGVRADETQFHADIARLVKGARAEAAKPKKAQAQPAAAR